jgi:hypothetical protein
MTDFSIISGLRVKYNLRKAPGERVVSVETRCAHSRIPHYHHLDVNEDYGLPQKESRLDRNRRSDRVFGQQKRFWSWERSSNRA